MAGVDGKGRARRYDVFVLVRGVSGKREDRATVSHFVRLSEAILNAERFLAVNTAPASFAEIWLEGQRCVYAGGSSDIGNASEAPLFPVAPGRYRWDEGGDAWRLAGPV